MLTLPAYVLKNLGRQKVRTVLTALGVMFGVWLVVLFHAISAGALASAEAMLTQFGEDFHCYQKGAADRFLSILPETETREKLLRVPGVRDTSAALFWGLPTEDSPFVVLVGLRPGEFALDSLLSRGSGEFLPDPELDQAILGETRRNQMGVERDEEDRILPGQTVKLGEMQLSVVGTFMTGKPIFDSAIIIPLSRMRELRGGEDVTNLLAVRVKEGVDRVEVAREVERLYPGLTTVCDLEELAKVDPGLKRLETWTIVITVVASIIGVLIIMLAMVMSVVERTREVGILRAVGWRKRQIVAIVLVEAMVMAFLGVALGIPTGLLGVEVIAAATNLGEFMRPAYEIGLFIQAMLAALLAAAFGSLYPAWRASRLRPVEAIRHE